MGAEIELKLATSSSGLRAAMALPWLKEMAGENVSREHLTSIYFDTDDLTLRENGVTLRVRKSGRQILQTIKAASAAPIERAEWEAEIDRLRPRLELAHSTALGPLLTGELANDLKPVFETAVQRVVMPLHIGRSEVEVAFDEGCVATADDHVEIAEIEIELKQGDRSDVARIARKLARNIPVTLGVRAKAEWGYALLDGTIDAPVPAAPVTIAPDATLAEAFAVVGFACLRHVAGNEFAVRRGAPEGIHQMRVGLRRLRAALSLFKGMLHGADRDRLKRELKWMTKQLGPAREYNVFIAKTVEPCRAARPEWGELEALAHDLEKHCAQGLANGRRAVDSQRFRGLVLGCALWLLDGEWLNTTDSLIRVMRERPASAFVCQELTRRGRKIIKRGRKLNQLDPKRQHKLRIAAKKVRYGRQFFKSLMLDRPRKAGRKIDCALKNLQKALGSLNDMRVHLELARDYARINSAARKAFAVGYLVGGEDARSGGVLAQALNARRRLKKAA